MSVMSSRLETPTTLKIKLDFKKKKKDGSGGAPDKEPPSRPGFPSGEDEEKVSVISLSDEDGSDKGDAGASADSSLPPPHRK